MSAAHVRYIKYHVPNLEASEKEKKRFFPRADDDVHELRNGSYAYPGLSAMNDARTRGLNTLKCRSGYNVFRTAESLIGKDRLPPHIIRQRYLSDEVWIDRITCKIIRFE